MVSVDLDALGGDANWSSIGDGVSTRSIGNQCRVAITFGGHGWNQVMSQRWNDAIDASIKYKKFGISNQYAVCGPIDTAYKSKEISTSIIVDRLKALSSTCKGTEFALVIASSEGAQVANEFLTDLAKRATKWSNRVIYYSLAGKSHNLPRLTVDFLRLYVPVSASIPASGSRALLQSLDYESSSTSYSRLSNRRFLLLDGSKSGCQTSECLSSFLVNAVPHTGVNAEWLDLVDITKKNPTQVKYLTMTSADILAAVTPKTTATTTTTAATTTTTAAATTTTSTTTAAATTTTATAATTTTTKPVVKATTTTTTTPATPVIPTPAPLVKCGKVSTNLNGQCLYTNMVCVGTFTTGLCPKGNDYQCCIPNPPATTNADGKPNFLQRFITRFVDGVVRYFTEEDKPIPAPTTPTTPTTPTVTPTTPVTPTPAAPSTTPVTCANNAGICKSTSLGCAGGSFVKNQCPGSTTNQCCIVAPVTRCGANSIGVCQKTSVACQGGVFQKGLCPGATDNQCCLPSTPAAVVPVVKPTVTPTTTTVTVPANLCKKAANIANFALSLGESGSKALALGYVTRYITSAGIPFYPSKNAKDCGKDLVSAGFVPITVVSGSALRPGDVRIIQGIKGHTTGHIQVYVGGETNQWVSSCTHTHTRTRRTTLVRRSAANLAPSTDVRTSFLSVPSFLFFRFCSDL